MPEPAAAGAPRQTLSTWDGVAFIVGIVIGIGIFKTPSLVASNVGSETAFIGAWLLGGVVMLLGALCYAELGSAHPDAGGEYHFLSRAYGLPVGLLFGWARGTVIQTGAIAAVAFVYGEYAAVLMPLGPYSTAIHAAIGVVALTAINMAGTMQSRALQVTLTLLTIAALICVILAGLSYSQRRAGSPQNQMGGGFGLAMVFVLLTYGGWNEAAYLAGELKDPRRNMARTLLFGTGIVMLLYMLANLGYLKVFGLAGLSRTNPVGADLMRLAVGDAGAVVLSLIVCVCALSTLNATIFTGARTYYALGRDLSAIRALGRLGRAGPPAGQRAAAAMRDRAGPGGVRCLHPRRLRGDGRLYGAGVLVLPVPGGAVGVRIPPARPRRAPLPHAAVPAAADPARRGGRLDVLLQHQLRGHRRPGRPRGAAGRHAAAAVAAVAILTLATGCTQSNQRLSLVSPAGPAPRCCRQPKDR